MTLASTPRRRAGALTLAAVLLLASAAAAEVRVRHADEPELDVHVTPTGPWTVLGSLDDSVLNPAGDAFADGLPGSGARAEELLASWIRGSCGDLRMSRWDGAEWTDWDALREPAAIGVPRVAPLGDGWALTWQRGGTGLRIVAAGASGAGEQGNPVVLLEGLLLDATFVDDVEIVLFRDAGSARLRLAGVLWSVPGVPSPVDVLWLQELQVGDLGDASLHGNQGPATWAEARLEPSEWPDAAVITWGGEAYEVKAADGALTPVLPRKESGKPMQDAPKRGQRTGQKD